MTPADDMDTRTVDGIELALVDRGSGPVVVMIHGFPLDHSMWNAQIDALAAEYRVIVPDLRGFGRSGLTEGTVTMGRLADDVAGLLDAVAPGERVTLCGLSMGGYVAFQFWRKYATRLKALVLCDTRAKNDTPEMAAARLEMADRVLREGPGPLVEMMMPKLFAERTVKEHPEVVDALRQVMTDTDRRGIAAAGRGMAQREDMTESLGKIDCPVQVIVGQLDAISPAEEMRLIAEAIPRAEFVEIAGSGHMSPMEKPAEFNAALLEFLDRV